MAPENQTQTLHQQLTLKSKDGKEFPIPRSAGELSGIITTAIEDDINGDGVILVPEVYGEILSKVVSYLKLHGDASVSEEEKKEFDRKFVESEDLGGMVDVLLAANFLEIKSLLDMLTKKVGKAIENKSVEWIRRKFGIVNDYTPEEEEAQKKEDEWAHQGVDPDDDDDDDDDDDLEVMARRRRID